MKRNDGDVNPFLKPRTHLIFLLSSIIALCAVLLIRFSIDSSPGGHSNSMAELPAINEEGEALIAIISGTPIYADHGTSQGAIDIEPPIVLPNFTLHSGQQQVVRLSDFRGRYVLLFFGYTHCPDVCPLTLEGFRRVDDELEEELRDDIAYLFVTLDPERDTPERLSEYLSNFDVPIEALWGNDEEIAEMGQPFGLEWEIIEPGEQTSMKPSGDHQHHLAKHEGDYLINHTSSRFLIDPEGLLIRRFLYHPDPNTSAAWILADLRPILKISDQDRSAVDVLRWQ